MPKPTLIIQGMSVIPKGFVAVPLVEYELVDNQLTLAVSLLNRALPLFGDDMPDIEEEGKVAEAATDLVENGPFSSRVTRVQKLERVLFLASQLKSVIPLDPQEKSFVLELMDLVRELNSID